MTWTDDASFHRSGSGEPLVLIHGFTSSWHIWKPVVEQLEDRYDVIAMSMPGHLGWPWPDDVPVSMQSAVDLVAARFRELGLERPAVVGNSLGGALALWMASQDLTSHAIGLSPALGWEPGSIKVERLFRAARDNVGAFFPQAAEILATAQARKDLLSVFMNRGDLVPLEEAVRMWEAVLAVTRMDDFITVLDDFELPTLDEDQTASIIWCGDDKLLPIDRTSRGWREHAPHAPFTVLEGVGHSPMYDDPERVAAAIVEALGR